MTDSFGFNEEKELDLERNPTERVEELKRMVLDANTSDPEEIMLLIMKSILQKLMVQWMK